MRAHLRPYHYTCGVMTTVSVVATSDSVLAVSFHGWVQLQRSCVSDPCNTLFLQTALKLGGVSLPLTQPPCT
jgi:hypothetical protein